MQMRPAAIKKTQKKNCKMMSHFYSSLEDPLAGVGGVEPPITESKSVALPLGYTPIYDQASREIR